jgi:1,2-diacylglycerol 3-beta-galactosyltransferase
MDSLFLVPTEKALQRALDCGISRERIKITGLPVSPCFVEEELSHSNKQNTSQTKSNIPTILILGGAEGMGKFINTCKAIAQSGLQARLVMITGHNERLYKKLKNHVWPLPVRIEKFVDNMHEWMNIADILVTKAGPSTISEALVMGLPMVLSSALPGHEQPNVTYVVEGGAGIWAPKPDETAAVVRDLLESNNKLLDEMAKRARILAKPEAAYRVAKIVGDIVVPPHSLDYEWAKISESEL